MIKVDMIKPDNCYQCPFCEEIEGNDMGCSWTDYECTLQEDTNVEWAHKKGSNLKYLYLTCPIIECN